MHERFCFIVLDEHPEQQMMKTIQVKDKIIREPVSNVDFFSLMDRLKFWYETCFSLFLSNFGEYNL